MWLAPAERVKRLSVRSPGLRLAGCMQVPESMRCCLSGLGWRPALIGCLAPGSRFKCKEKPEFLIELS